MFPERPRQPIPQRPRRPFEKPMSRRRNFHGPQLFGPPIQEKKPIQHNLNTVKAMFQTEDGSWDYEKMMSTAQQLNGVYQQVSPLVTGFLKK